MGEGLGVVLPRVGRGVEGHERLLPEPVVGGGVVTLEGVGVVVGLVAEQVAEPGQPVRIGEHERLPVPVADLVADVAERGAVRLAEREPVLLPGDRVRLGEVERDEPVGVADGDAVVVGGSVEPEAQVQWPAGRVDADLPQLADDAALRRLEHRELGAQRAPCPGASSSRQARHQPAVSAGRTAQQHS